MLKSKVTAVPPVNDGTLPSIAEDIATMRVRGAGKIARHAARGLAAWERDSARFPDARSFDEGLRRAEKTLLDTRPSAVSLRNAVRFVGRRVRARGTVEAKREALRAAAKEFETRSKEAVAGIGRQASGLVKDGGTYLTHCNSQAALAGFIEARKAGRHFEVLATETRPWKQGLLTSRELADAGVPVTLIVDSAAYHEMPRVDAVFVGCDTIAANGDVVNKVGTSAIALFARELGVPFHVCGETYKIDVDTPSGAEVVIEERDAAEIADPKELPGVRILNPVFDVTVASRVTDLLTEVGTVAPADARATAVKVWEL